MFASIRRASSFVSNLAAESTPRFVLEIDIGELLTVVIAHHADQRGAARAAEEGRSITNYLESLIVRNGEKKRPKKGR
jgi:hypothetical protein